MVLDFAAVDDLWGIDYWCAMLEHAKMALATVTLVVVVLAGTATVLSSPCGYDDRGEEIPMGE